MKNLVATCAVVFLFMMMLPSGASAFGDNELPSSPRVRNYEEVLRKFSDPADQTNNFIGGNITMRLLVSKTGKVLEMQWYNSEPHVPGKAFLRHIKNLEFEPARDAQGERISSWVILPIQFRLR